MSEGTIRFQRRQANYTQISNVALRDKRMSLAVRGLFALMLSLPLDRAYKTGYLVKAADIGRDTLFRYFAVLEEFGYLKREQTHKKDGQFGTNTYFLDDDPTSPCMDFPNTVKPDTAEPDMVEPNTENADTKERTKRKNIPPRTPQGGKRVPESAQWKPERFEAFWAYYRVHVNPANRAAARKAWDKLKPDDATIRDIGMALKARLRTDEEWKRGIGRPHASTYLNGQQWLDTGPTTPVPLKPSEGSVREEDQWIS